MPSTDPALPSRLRRELQGEVLFDEFSRGRYATDASFYQIEPIGVVLPRNEEDVARTMQIARDLSVPVIPRGAGTSQGGQAIGEALIIDTSKYLTRILRFDRQAHRVTVEPGVVLDHLNASLAPNGLFFPVDVATASQATIGGMTGNNSAGARSIRYGQMVDNVISIDATLADGNAIHFGEVSGDAKPNGDPSDDDGSSTHTRYQSLIATMRDLYGREAEEIERRFPKVLRRVAGYNIDRISDGRFNMSDLLVGSEGTLGMFTRIELDLQPTPPHRVLGVCHFPTLHAAMDAVQHIVELNPSAVELLDETLLSLARDNASFRASVQRFTKGAPAALLLVEFSGEELDGQIDHLTKLEDLMGTLGHPDAVVRAADSAFQQEIWSVRKAGLNIVMSMKSDGKPVAFIEDCAVPLEHVAEYTDRLNEVFQRHGTTGTWYAHASVGCLHVRPTLNLKQETDVRKMRTIAEEAHALVREFKGSHSGEHGDGLVRSEFLEPMLGKRIVRAFEEVKHAFDPTDLLNPGNIVNPRRMDDRSLFRYTPDYSPQRDGWTLDWSEWNGFHGAIEMCNNNGACRKMQSGVMCPSYRVTHDEQHTTRGRANSLRLAISGQLGADALTSDSMRETMDLCIGCKACKTECPTGVDMARMKIEFLSHYQKRHGVGLRDRLVAFLPRYAIRAARLRMLLNSRNRFRSLAWLGERWLGLSAKRALPSWRSDWFNDTPPVDDGDRPEIVLWVDTFNTFFEPENARAAVRVLEAAGYRVTIARDVAGGRPLCCGRTFLNAGMVDEARVELRRVLNALKPYADRGVPIVGLEPSCLLTLRDEAEVLFTSDDLGTLPERAMLLEEFLRTEAIAGRLELPLRKLPVGRVLLHGHCHQKAFGTVAAVAGVLRWIPDLDVEVIESGCCGMAGSFGYEAEHYDLSMKMAELDLLPAVRASGDDAWIVADGTSCRRQILDGTGRTALHTVRVLEAALADSQHGRGSYTR